MSTITAEFSLASFADQVTDDIKALDSLLPPAGLYGMKLNSVSLGVNEAKEGIDPATGMPYPPLPYVTFKYEVLEAQPLDKNTDPDSLVGRTWNERFTIWPKDWQACIGLIKGRYAKAGFDTSGRLGGLEGQEPGWLDGAVEQVAVVKIKHATNKQGNTNAYFEWIKPKPQANPEV